MTFERIAGRFLSSLKQPDGSIKPEMADHKNALAQLFALLPNSKDVKAISPDQLRDLLSRRFVEQATSRKLRDYIDQTDEVEPGAFLESLGSFFDWASENSALPMAEAFLQVVSDLRQSVPRAILIGVSLSKETAARGAAATFPEFLSSFEQGGASRYDIDSPGERGSIEGYFRIRRVESILVEAEELITEEVVWPVEFPPETASLLSEGFIINMEIIKEGRAWRIAGSGFAYPPGTDI